MIEEARRAWWVHYRSAQDCLREVKHILSILEDDLRSMSRAMKDEPMLIQGGWSYVVNRLDDLGRHAHEIDDAVRAKRQDGEEADRRIDRMVGVL